MARFLAQGFEQRAEQRMLLQPRMLQALEVLQLPSLELASHLERAAEENEAVLLVDPRPPEPAFARRRTSSERADDWLAEEPDRRRSLSDLVEEQLALLPIEDALQPWVRLVVQALDPAGYLSAGDERLLELAAEQGLEPCAGRLGRAIALVQRLEPRGIGGRNAVEALLIQLDPDDPDYRLLCALLEDFLEELSANKLPSVARSLGIDLERLGGLIETLRGLSPRPLAGLIGEDAPTIRPEVVVEPTPDGGFEVRVDGSGLPSVAVDPSVRRLARDRTQTAEVRRYLGGKLARARWLVAAVEERRRTLHAVAAAVFGAQRRFLEDGRDRLVPLSMSALASELGIHTSTVSRAVAGKHAQTPWGIFPLRHFFQAGGGASHAQRGTSAVAQDRVRRAVARVFAGEDPARPLSDDDVVRALSAEGVPLARRTVAKYRKELGIPSSYRRRKY